MANKKRKHLGHITKEELMETCIIDKKTGCWNWFGAKDSGYGAIRRHKRSWRANRVAKFMFHDTSLETFMNSKIFACHSCDNRACINPDHIFWGTRQDNIDDCVKKGRQQRGEKNPLTKFNANDIIDIFYFRKEGFTHRAIANIYDVHQPTITKILNRQNWRHVDVSNVTN
jgi:hypothetical protein